VQCEGEAGRLLPAGMLEERLEVGCDGVDGRRDVSGEFSRDVSDVSISCAFGAPAFAKLGQFRGADEGEANN